MPKDFTVIGLFQALFLLIGLLHLSGQVVALAAGLQQLPETGGDLRHLPVALLFHIQQLLYPGIHHPGPVFRRMLSGDIFINGRLGHRLHLSLVGGLQDVHSGDEPADLLFLAGQLGRRRGGT